MAIEVDLSCPQCGESVLDTMRQARQSRATCPQCHVELVRESDLAHSTWRVEKPTPLADEELGVGD